MNVMLLSVPRSGSTYVAELIRSVVGFSHMYYDPVDVWKNESQHAILDEIEHNSKTNSVFIRHNSHFFGLASDVRDRFEAIFKNSFHVIKLIRSDSMFDITLSHCYSMLTGISHDNNHDSVPTIRITPELFLQELVVCETRQNGLSQFKHYNELMLYSDLTNDPTHDYKLFKLEKSRVHDMPENLKPNIEKHLKIENYSELVELYRNAKHDT